MNARRTVLVFAEPASRRSSAAAELEALGYTVTELGQPPEAARARSLPVADLIVLDLGRGATFSGLDAAAELKKASGVPVLVLVEGADTQRAGFIQRAFALDCLVKPGAPAALRTAVELAIEKHLRGKAQQSDGELSPDLVGETFDLICTHDMHGKLLSVNAAAARALGYEVGELVGRNLQDLLVPQVRHLFPAYLAEIREKGVAHGLMRMSTATGEVREWEYHNFERQRENRMRFVRGLAHDVTEQMRAARELRASEQRFRALFEQAAVGVAQVDSASGKIQSVNRKYASILGYSPEELASVEFLTLVHPEDRAGHQALVKRLECGEVAEFVVEQRLLCKDGTEVWVGLSVAPLRQDGAPSDQYIAVTQDITERKRAEAQRTTLEAQLRQAQKMEAIGTLAGGIAHDFNNLLTTMVGNIELARQDVEAGHAAAESLGAAAAAARRATDLVRQILAFSRKQPSQRAVIPLAPIIEDAAKLLRASLPASIDLELKLQQAPPVLADATQVHQVVMNLCTNAWHAITQDRGQITVTLDSTDVPPSPKDAQQAPQGRCARIRVKDNGEGMDRQTLERIFEPFFTTKEVGRGSGLGLSVALGIVKEHGGTITAESNPGGGAVFEVLLPAAQPAARPQATSSETPKPASGRGRVLYVDDEKALGLTVGRLLKSLGYEPIVCQSGAEAVDLLRANPAGCDVVLTDYSMPGLSGLDVAREVGRIRPGLPVILTSGYAERAGDDLKAAGIHLRLDKPFDRAALADALNRALSGR